MRNLNIILIFAMIFSLSFASCGRDIKSDDITLQTDPAGDFDKDGLINSEDPDDDNDGCPDLEDPDAFNAAIGCNSTDDYYTYDPVDPACKDNGEFVTVIDAGSVATEIEDCLTTKSFPAKVKVKVYWCTDHRDALTINGRVLGLKSYTLGMGDHGADPAMHQDCNNNTESFLVDGERMWGKAIVVIDKEGESSKKLIWKLPAFSSFYLDIPDLDGSKETKINNIKQIRGTNYSRFGYAITQNGFPNMTHILTFNDTWGGAWVYGLEFEYHYHVLKEGYYE